MLKGGWLLLLDMDRLNTKVNFNLQIISFCSLCLMLAYSDIPLSIDVKILDSETCKEKFKNVSTKVEIQFNFAFAGIF